MKLINQLTGIPLRLNYRLINVKIIVHHFLQKKNGIKTKIPPISSHFSVPSIPSRLITVDKNEIYFTVGIKISLNEFIILITIAKIFQEGIFY